jgi:Na+/melibiose symporter-like transporter
MSWIPAAFAFAAAALMMFYPLNCQQNKQIGQDLLLQRKPLAGNA